MPDPLPEIEPNRRQWAGFWFMILQQTQNAFNDKFAQFTLIPLAGAVGFVMTLPGGIELDVPSAAGLMIATPMVLFAPLAGWLSDRFSKRDVMLGAAIAQTLVLGIIVWAVLRHDMVQALAGFFALSVQSAFFSPAKFGINKELVGSRHLGFAAGVQQMTAILAILAGQIFAGWLFDHRFTGHHGDVGSGWNAALMPLVILAVCAVPSLVLAIAIPRVPAQGHVPFTPRLLVSHFLNLADLWRDVPLRRASFGVAFFWGFAAFINLWSVKLAKSLTHGGEGYGTLASEFLAAASLGMAAGFGFAAWLLRRRIELGWIPAAGLVMTVMALTLSFATPGGAFFLTALALLAFSAAVFLAPLNAWMQDRYPADARGEMQSAVNLQDCLAGIIAVLVLAAFEFGMPRLGVAPDTTFRVEMAFVAGCCGIASLAIIRLLPADFFKLVLIAFVRSVYRIRSVHSGRMPATGGVLLLPNHVTFADAFFITAASPRPVRFVMDEHFTANRVVGAFTALFDTVPIRRDQPREAIRVTIDALRNGDVVCLFPEGQLTRTGALCELRRGFELIARKAGHPLVPMWCDGSWGSVFSFERNRFFSKWPQRVPFGMTIAFGEPIDFTQASLAVVEHGMRKASAEAIAARFSQPGWAIRIPKHSGPAVASFRASGETMRRRMWVNGHQIGHVNALQRRQPFNVLTNDPVVIALPGLNLTFPELFTAYKDKHLEFDAETHGAWAGGDLLRTAIAASPQTDGIVFYDFSANAIEPLEAPGLTHCPCLAIEGVVVAMSMPDPPVPSADSDPQSGRKAGSWGKLLPGFYLEKLESRWIAHGPATPPEGLTLPAGCEMDSEGFIVPQPNPSA